MIRKQTIVTAVAKINDLDSKRMDLESAAEREFGFVTEKVQKQADKLEERSEKEFAKIVARLHGDGLCSEYGVAAAEADQDIFAGIESLWAIGDGTWC